MIAEIGWRWLSFGGLVDMGGTAVCSSMEIGEEMGVASCQFGCALRSVKEPVMEAVRRGEATMFQQLGLGS